MVHVNPLWREWDPETKRYKLTAEQGAYLDWLTGVDRPEGETQGAFATRVGVHRSTLHKWKNDASFIAAWNERIGRTLKHPETIQRQLEAFRVKAEAGDDKAMTAYWKLVDRLMPPKAAEADPKSVERLSNEELEAQVRKLHAV